METNSSLNRPASSKALLQHLVQGLGKIHARRPAGGLGQIGKLMLGLGDDRIRMCTAFFQDGADDALLFLGQGDQQVQREHHLAVVPFGDSLGLLQRLLGLLRKFV